MKGDPLQKWEQMTSGEDKPLFGTRFPPGCIRTSALQGEGRGTGFAPDGQNESYEITDLAVCRSLCETESRASPLARSSGPAMLPRAVSTAGSEVTGFFH